VDVFGLSKNEFRIFLNNSLKNNEKKILLESYKLRGNTFSFIVRSLSSKYPESTLKVVLKRLKKFNLVNFGGLKNKGTPLRITKLGLIILKIIDYNKVR